LEVEGNIRYHLASFIILNFYAFSAAEPFTDASIKDDLGEVDIF